MSTATPTRSDSGPPVWGCAKHARLGRTCCQDTEILVTGGDRARIAAHVAEHAELPQDFWADAWPRHPTYCDDGSDPGWTLAFHVDGSRPVVRQRADGDCTFLGPRGCALPLEVRPLICRLYPYLYDERSLTQVDAERCPAEVIPPGSSMVELLEMDPSAAERWRDQLYAEIRETPGRGRAP